MVNFINILDAHFLYKSVLRRFFYLHVAREKLAKGLSYQKGEHKALMKLTPNLRKNMNRHTRAGIL
jgi:hypothetical protein